MSRLILVRHGKSSWNNLNRFTGWVDIDLCREGIDEAVKAGKHLQDIPIDVVFTSTLVRAQMTASLIMAEHKDKKPLLFLHPNGKLKSWGADCCLKEALDLCIPTHVSWHLNERYYGKLQGMDKDEARSKFGKEQVHIWRRSYDVKPPGGESLHLTIKRTWPYFKKKIEPLLAQGKNVLIVAHGNSLRSIVMHLEGLTREEVVNLEIPTGKPLFYDCSNNTFTKHD